MTYDVKRIRADFPILQQSIHGKPLIYLDNSSTTQKPKPVLQAIQHYYENLNANIHRGIHTLSQQATVAYEQARSAVQNFINAKSAKEIIFVRGVTEAMNMLAHTFGRIHLKAGDEVIISVMEHHSTIVPWQEVCQQVGAHLRIIPMSETGELNITDYEKLFSAKTKLVSLVHVSNVIGTINPIKQMIATAHAHNVPIIIDGAQAVSHMPIDVQDLDCDFYLFSGHKMYAPTGIGILYGKEKFLNEIPPYQFGGGMIRQVNFTNSSYLPIPEKFEAGTPNIEGAIGLHAAIDYLNAIGMEAIHQHENDLLDYATNLLQKIPGLKIIGNAAQKAGVISLVMADIHPHDIGTVLDSEGIATRAGHHCAMPLIECLGLAATLRVSFGIYNTKEDIDALINALLKVQRVFNNG